MRYDPFADTASPQQKTGEGYEGGDEFEREAATRLWNQLLRQPTRQEVVREAAILRRLYGDQLHRQKHEQGPTFYSTSPNPFSRTSVREDATLDDYATGGSLRD